MKLGITAQLFTAVLSTAMAVALAMGIFTHVNLNRDFIGYLNEQDLDLLNLVQLSATAGYRENGNSWEFIRREPRYSALLLHKRLSEAELIAMKQSPAELTGATRRFTLLDQNRQRLFGYPRPPDDAIERPIVVDGLTVGWLLLTPVTSVNSGAEKRFADAQMRSAWAVGGAAVLLAAGVAFWASRRLLRPVQRVAAATHQLAAGSYDTRVAESAGDGEIARLSQDFNHLALTLQRNESMRSEFMADVSHELRTPLGILNGELEALEDGVRRFDDRTLRSLRGEVRTLYKLVDDLYDLSLAGVGALSYRKSELDLRALVETVAESFAARLRNSGLSLDLDLPAGPVMTLGDQKRLQQLFSNLLENSCRYTDAGGRVILSLQREGDRLVVDVHDTAPGVLPEHLPRLFERFFRVEPSRNRASGGAGLGLSICQRIAEAHSGTIEARPSTHGGLWMRVGLPGHA